MVLKVDMFNLDPPPHIQPFMIMDPLYKYLGYLGNQIEIKWLILRNEKKIILMIDVQGILFRNLIFLFAPFCIFMSNLLHKNL
jgi:hypothetical protein